MAAKREAARRERAAVLEFRGDLNDLGEGKEIRDGLSAVLQIGDTLWLANDETASLERLSRRGEAGGGPRYGDHVQFPLEHYVTLPKPPADGERPREVDVEGLTHAGGYLWLVGSHSRARGKPAAEKSDDKNRDRLAKVRGKGNRYLLARIPLIEETLTLAREVDMGDGPRTAAQLAGDAEGNALTEALADDEHVAPFLAIPGKDNGFDVEGIAVVDGRVFVGLRGPVLRGWAIVLELAPEAHGAELRLQKIGPRGRVYRKHFLELGGLGVRDLVALGDDLLVLAGPTQDLDGPVLVYRWRGGARAAEESVVFADALERVLDVPHGQGADEGRDHAEGITLYAPDGAPARGTPRTLLVVYDAPAKGRLSGGSAVEADLFAL